MPKSFLAGITPFIVNMSKDQKGLEPRGPQGKLEVTENGNYNVARVKDLTVAVPVPDPEEVITPEEEEKIVNEEKF